MGGAVHARDGMGWDGMGLTVFAAAEADVEVVECRAESERGEGLRGVDGYCSPWRARARLFARRDVERWRGILQVLGYACRDALRRALQDDGEVLCGDA